MLQIGVWFSYGCASMAVKNWENAAKCFRRCVAIETQVRTNREKNCVNILTSVATEEHI